MTFPELDEWGRPRAKLPDCPRCGEDELGVVHEGLLKCYLCGWSLDRLSCGQCGGQEIHTRLRGYRCPNCEPIPLRGVDP